MDPTTIAESLFELKTKGPYALDALDLLNDEIRNSLCLDEAQRQSLLALLAQVEVRFHLGAADHSLSMLVIGVLEDKDVAHAWSALVADNIVGLR